MKKRFLLISLLFVSLFIFAGCGGSSNELVGSWKGLTDGDSRENQLETTFTFKSDNTVEYENEFGIKGSGTYEIKDNTVVITLDTWSEAKTYNFKVDGSKLSLTATDQYSPSYSEMTKQ